MQADSSGSDENRCCQAQHSLAAFHRTPQRATQRPGLLRRRQQPLAMCSLAWTPNYPAFLIPGQERVALCRLQFTFENMCPFLWKRVLPGACQPASSLLPGGVCRTVLALCTACSMVCATAANRAGSGLGYGVLGEAPVRVAVSSGVCRKASGELAGSAWRLSR